MGKFVLTGVAVVLLAGTALFAAPATNSPTAISEEESAWAKNVLESYKTLQEQQQDTMRAVQQAREETAAAAKRNTDALEARLNQLEQAVVNQREREVETLSNSHKFTLTVVGIFAGIGFIGLLIFALFLLRALNRRPATVTVQPVGEFTAAGQLSSGATGLAPLDPAQQSGARLRSSLERLEQRLNELETVPSPPVAVATNGGASVGQQMIDLSSRVALLLGKGQSLANLQQVDGALACYDEVIALDPTNAEAFVKKGAALEKLGLLDEAIECYDRAIALDTSMTMAYLCKGGVFNRLERYGEAVKCYEEALRAQHKSGA